MYKGVVDFWFIELEPKPWWQKDVEFEYKHNTIIDQFDRYPHRIAILGRKSTAEEIEFLKQDISSF